MCMRAFMSSCVRYLETDPIPNLAQPEPKGRQEIRNPKVESRKPKGKKKMPLGQIEAIFDAIS
jgi:hypothetical protein